MGFVLHPGGGGWRLRHAVLFVMLWMFLHRTAPVLGCASVNCNVVLTEARGEFKSPCYPQNYPNSYSCKWTLQAPTGFIIQLSFLDFEVEEAQNCMYDRVVVNSGNAESKFCGLTASGLTLNSTRNVMEVSFVSDFSIQKRGFLVSFQHVALALRNQKVRIPNGDGQIAEVTSYVSIPALSELTICFEVERTGTGQREWLFTYYDINRNVLLSFGYNLTGMEMVIDGVICPVESIISAADFTSSMKSFCVLWSSSNGRVAVYFNGNYWGKTCSPSSGHTVPAGGVFTLGGQMQSFRGSIYNLRLWNRAMTLQELNSLTCDMAGSVIDWDNNQWSISSALAQTDNTLSCICYPNCTRLTAAAAPTSGSNPATGCDSGGLGCSAASSPTTSSTDSTNTSHANLISHVPTPIPSISAPTTSMPLTPIIISSSSSSSASTTINAAAATPSPTTPSSTNAVIAATSSTTHAEQTTTIGATVSSASTNLEATNNTELEGLFYRVSFTAESELNQQAAQRVVALWMNQTFQNWTHSVDDVRVLQSGASNSYTCQALLMISNESLGEADVLAQLLGNLAGTGRLVRTADIRVRLIENCPEDNYLHYLWAETKPRITQYLPCFPNKDLSASRTCLINPETFVSQWSTANFTNCTVTAENAADVAEQLANFSRNNLSKEEVSQVVTKVHELVNVAKIDAAVAESVVNIISNVMVGPDKAPVNTSNIALKAVEELANRVEFDGPSVNITSKNLALGVLALDARSFNGTSFSAFFLPNSTDPKIEFDRTANPLAQVTLPASLLSGVSSDDLDRSSLSRINFMFFSNPSFFVTEHKGLSLNSYVVASSVGNISITDLKDPVKIEIAHLSEQVPSRRECVFWDFSINKGSGGWNNRGCSVSEESTGSRTVCLCSHLTHFGILMDVSQTSFQIDPKNKKVLTFLSYIGCGVSAICSAATLLTYIAFEKLRRDYPSKILMNLSTSLLLLNVAFLLDGWLASMFRHEGLCTAAAVLLHYFLLTSFTWMGLESVHMYIALVKVFNTYIRRYILKFCILGWGSPALLVGIVVSVNKNYYGILRDSNDESAMMCWIKERSVFYTTCVGYFCLVFLLNVAMFVVVMMQICGRNGKRSNRTLREEILRNLRSVVSLTFLLGMTWGFALFAWGPVYLPFTYLFTIFNSLQGLFIFIFHCALKENVQKQWRRYLCCGPYRLSENSDWSKTPTNNTKKVSSDNLAKSLSSSSFGSSAINWTSKAKATLTPFTKRNRGTDKRFSNQTGPKCVSSSSSSSEGEPNSSSPSSILPVSQMIDKVKGYCSTRTDNFYKNIMMSDSFPNCTRL